MRSGRLAGQISGIKWMRAKYRPCGCENVYSSQALSTIHLGQQLIHHSVGHARTVMPSKITNISKRGMHGIETDRPLGGNRVELIEEQDTRLRRRSSIKNISNLRNRFKKTENSFCSIRTDFSLAPIYLFKSSGPLMLMKFSPHSLATAEARSVLPHPG